MDARPFPRARRAGITLTAQTLGVQDRVASGLRRGRFVVSWRAKGLFAMIEWYVRTKRLLRALSAKAADCEMPLAVTRKSRAWPTIVGGLNYQACDDLMCYAPATAQVTWTVEGS